MTEPGTSSPREAGGAGAGAGGGAGAGAWVGAKGWTPRAVRGGEGGVAARGRGGRSGRSGNRSPAGAPSAMRPREPASSLARLREAGRRFEVHRGVLEELRRVDELSRLVSHAPGVGERPEAHVLEHRGLVLTGGLEAQRRRFPCCPRDLGRRPSP